MPGSAPSSTQALQGGDKSPTSSSIDGLLRRAAGKSGLIGMAGGLPARATFPRGALLSACKRVLLEGKVDCLQYDWPEGRPRLRTWIAERLRARGCVIDPEDVIITNGAQEALDLALEILEARDRRMYVGCTSYPAALELFRRRDWRLLGNDFAAPCAYVMPSIDNPRGLTMGTSERQRLLAANGTILEDDVYAELCFGGKPARPLLADAPTRVLHIGSFSKILCPGLRIGWLIVPSRLRARARHVRTVRNVQANGFAQGVLEHVVHADDFEARIVKLRNYYARRAERLERALRKSSLSVRFTPPLGGFSCWLETDRRIDDARLLERAYANGVSFDPGSLFRYDGQAQPLALRLSFSNLSPSEISLGVRRLQDTLRDCH